MTFAARFAARSLAIAPQFDIATHVQALDARAAISAGTLAEGDDGFWMRSGREHPFRPYVVVEGVLQIPVKGILMCDFPYQFEEMATGYEYISAALERGLSDAAVHTIALCVDSPGGIVTRCFETADEIYAARSQKRIVAYVQDLAASAAYALASSAHDIFCTRTAQLGSIGVLTRHVDRSGQYEQNGIVKTYIFAGAHKADGNDAEPLPDDVKARIEGDLAVIYDVFVSTVARNRSLDEATIRATEAQTYMAPEAVEMELADAVSSYATAVSAGRPPLDQEEDYGMVTQADLDAAVTAARTEEQTQAATALAAAITEARAEGARDGVAAERERIAAITGSDEAKKRPAAAQQAVKLGLSLDAAKEFLSAMPEENVAAPAGAGAPAGRFAAAMDEDGGSGVRAGQEGNDDGAPDALDIDNVFQLAGRKRKAD